MIGGGAISSPILRVLGMEGRNASASCLPMVLFSAGTAAFSWYLNAPPTSLGPDVMAASVLGVSAVLFSPIGVKLSVKLSGKVVGRAMGVFMCVVGAVSAYILYSEEMSDKPARVAAKMADTPEKAAMLAGLGMMTGLLGGLFGIGGGFILVPVLVSAELFDNLAVSRFLII